MKYIIYLLSSAVVVSSAIVVFNTVVKKEVVENNNVEVNEQNYVYDKGNGLVWLKCDYGLAGKDCDIPNDCGFDGTRQGANDIKLEDAPACSPEWDYGATIRVKNTPVLSNYRYVDSDDSGVAVCSNGVLCKDGAFIIAEALHEENYNYANDAQFVKVPNAEKDRACENHGGIATFGSEKIYNWELPTIDELETLNDEEEGINSKLFPNASKEFLSINQAVGDVPNPYQTVVFEPKKDIAIDDTDINAPVKCVFRVEPEEQIVDQSSDNETFCSINLPKTTSLKYEYFDERTEKHTFVDTEDKLSWSSVFYNPKDYTGYFYLNYNKSDNTVVIARDDGYKKRLFNEIKIENPFTVYDLLPSKTLRNHDYHDEVMSNDKRVINGMSCTLIEEPVRFYSKDYDDGVKVRKCISQEYCISLGSIFYDDFYDDITGKRYKKGDFHSMITLFETEFDEKIVEIPDTYDYDPEYSNDPQQIPNNEELFEDFYEEDDESFEEEYDDTSEIAPDNHCKEMKATCAAQGMDYTYDECVPFCQGQNCAYHSKCELEDLMR